MKHGHKNLMVALAGQPNCGKSTVFNMLTGMSQHVANFPGVTVEKKQGIYKDGDFRIEVVDLPGTYSLTSYSQEERVARDFLLLQRPEVLVAVIDASNIERHLYLVSQLREMRIPMVLCLNMADVAERRGFKVDTEKLSEMISMPVISANARRGVGGAELKKAILEVAETADHDPGVWRLDYGSEMEPVLERITARLMERPHLMEDFAPRWLAVKLMEADADARRIVQHHTHDGSSAELVEFIDAERQNFIDETKKSPERLIAATRYNHASEIVNACVTKKDVNRHNFTDKVDKLLCHPLLGFVAVALCMYITFTLTFNVADGWEWFPWADGFTTPVGACGWIFDEYLPGFFEGMAEGPLKSLILSGIIGGVGGVIGFVPIIFFMFVFLAIIEDSGYVARVAFLLDRFMRRFGLQGQSVLPLIVSGGIAGGCAVPGVMATRTIRDEKDKLTTMLVAPFMNCGAKMPVYGLLIGAFFAANEGAMMWLMALLSWAFALVGALILRKTVTKGEESPFVIELPPYHMPTLKGVLKSALSRSWEYVKKAGTIILAVSIIVWALMYFPRYEDPGFDKSRENASQEFSDAVGSSPVAKFFADDQVEDTEAFAEEYFAARDENDAEALEELEKSSPELYAFFDAVNTGGEEGSFAAPEHAAYAAYQDRLLEIDNAESEAGLEHSYAGRIGLFFEPVSSLAGFDWRDNIALVGGFAAKELVVSTLSTAYSMGESDPDEAAENSEHPLRRKLLSSESWNPLKAFALMLFVMLYAPCLATVAVIWRESGSWRWAVFSVIYSTALGFIVAVGVYQVGLALGVGLG